jgi:hypothetical protein
MEREERATLEALSIQPPRQRPGSARVAAGSEWRLSLAAAIVVATAIMSVSIEVTPSLAASCANEAVRSEQGATALPDCRAYELVSPFGGAPYLEEPSGHPMAGEASSFGGGIAWFSYNPPASSAGGGFYALSTRGPSGWATVSVSPHVSSESRSSFGCVPSMFFSADLSKGVLSDGFESDGPEQNSEKGYCRSNDPPLVENEPEGFQNIFLRDSATGTYRLINLTPARVVPADAWLQDASEDFSHIVFEDKAKLTPQAPAGASLYEWVNGAVHLVTVLPDGTPSEGSLPGAVSWSAALRGSAPYTHSVSADGSRVVFETAGKLYLRENPAQEQSPFGRGGECLDSSKACTVQLDASRASGPGGGGAFLAANAAGTEVFFSDGADAKLTADTVEGSGQHLYEYDTNTGALGDLTPAGESGLLGFSGISDDGSYLYLVAEGALAGGAAAGQPNLYVFHGGTVQLIATLAGEDHFDWTPSNLTARVSPNGRYIGFDSIQSLTGYDNKDATTGEPDQEVYLYDAATNALGCASCDPGGARPSGPAAIQSAEPTGNIPAPAYLQRNVLDDGRVFFETRSPLVSAAANAQVNVYEYAAGHLSLISSGSSDANSYFYDASPNGEDVFFVTSEHLVRSDAFNGLRLYDARVGGGFPEPESPVPCSGEGCRGPAQAVPTFSTPATENSQGSGNLVTPIGTPRTVKALTPKQKLERALRLCRREQHRRKRAACLRQARRRYGARFASAHDRGGHE